MDAALRPAPLLTQLKNGSHVALRRDDRRQNERFFKSLDAAGRRQLRRIVYFQDLSLGGRHTVYDGGSRRDQGQAILPLEPFLDDFHVEETEETAAEPEAEGQRGLRLVDERRIVEPQLDERVSQVLIFGRVGGIQAAEDQWLHFLVAGERLGSWLNGVGDRVADFHIGHLLHVRAEIADFS